MKPSFLLLCFFVTVSIVSLQGANSPNPRNLTKDEINPTDIFAIPLDSSEEEIDEEVNEMEEYSQAHEHKK